MNELFVYTVIRLVEDKQAFFAVFLLFARWKCTIYYIAFFRSRKDTCIVDIICHSPREGGLRGLGNILVAG